MNKPQDETLPTFKEIGKALGIRESEARHAYQRGIRKLRNCHPVTLRRLLALSAEKDKIRDGVANV